MNKNCVTSQKVKLKSLWELQVLLDIVLLVDTDLPTLCWPESAARPAGYITSLLIWNIQTLGHSVLVSPHHPHL